MHNRHQLIGAGLACVLGLSAGLSRGCELKVESAWIRAAPPSAMTLAAYAVLRNPGSQPLQITATSADGAQMAMLHESTVSNGVAQMRMLDSLTIPAGGEVRLTPGGKHVMLMGLKAVPKAGERMALSFTDAGGCTSRVEFTVLAAAPPTPDRQGTGPVPAPATAGTSL